MKRWRGTGPVRAGLAALALSMLAFAGAAGGQAGTATPSPEPSGEALARSVARLALFDLRAALRPAESDFALAAALLDLASQMRPGDTDLLHRQIEAVYAAGDQDRVLELTRELIRLDSANTVAQLRLISASIASGSQTGEERLAAYEWYLSGPRSQEIDAAVRSRLALDAALLLRERGDTDGFIGKLKLATALDPTHKEAAALAVTFFAERNASDRVGLLTLLQNLLKADPVDMNVHLALAREFAAGGAFAAARRFHTNAVKIALQDQGMTPELDLEQRVLQWQVDGPVAMAEQVRRELATAREAASRRLQQAQLAGMPLDQLVKPADIQLQAITALALVAAADASGDPDGTRAAINELTSAVDGILRRYDEAQRQGRATPEQSREAATEMVLLVQGARLWTGVQIDLAAKDLAESPGLAQLAPDRYAVLEAWVQLREGRGDAAIDALHPYAGRDDMAMIGTGLAHELAGRPEEARRAYEAVSRRSALQAEGAWCRSRLSAMGRRGDPAQSAALDKVAAAIPLWIDEMIGEPWKFLDLKVTVGAAAAEAGDDVPVVLRLQNLAPIPLALGSDRPLNTRVLLTPMIEKRDAAIEQLVRPEVADIDRRLRLLPREVLEVRVRPDLGYSGWLIESLAMRSTRLRWKAVQGFQLGRNGGYRPGVMCITAESESTIRRPVAEATLSVGELAARIQSAAPGDLPRLAQIVRARVFEPIFLPILPQPGLDAAKIKEALDASLEPLVRALTERYASLPPVERACIAVLVPHARLNPVLKPLDDVMRVEQHPLPLTVFLATRVVDPADEALIRAAGSPDERLRKVAAAVAERLGGTDKFYSRLTPEDFAPKSAEPAAEGGR
jgi:DNA-binding SARP family transcriptional activator